jgi:dolichol kinase
MFEELNEEMKRKIGRIVAGTVMIAYGVYLNNTYGTELVRNTYYFMVLIALIADFIRVDLKITIPIFQNQFPMRPSEKKGVHGTTFAAIGCLLALAFFDFDIAITAVAMAIYGDSIAAIFGKVSGKSGFHIHGEKTIAGSSAMFLTSILIGFIFINNIILIVAMAFIATLFEMFIEYLPDDLILCPFIACGGQLVAMLMGLRSFPNAFPYAVIGWVILIAALAAIYLVSDLYKKLKR